MPIAFRSCRWSRPRLRPVHNQRNRAGPDRVNDRNGSVTESSIMPSTAAPVAVLLPGTGSDEVFVRRVFEIPLAAVGFRAITPAPRPGPNLAATYLEAL